MHLDELTIFSASSNMHQIKQTVHLDTQCLMSWDKKERKICPANRPVSQVEIELLRAQLNEVGPKELCSRLGARPLNTTQIWPHSTVPQPDGIGCESILRREENWSTQRKTLWVRLRSTESQPTYKLRMQSRVHRGGRHECYHTAILTPQYMYMYVIRCSHDNFDKCQEMSPYSSLQPRRHSCLGIL